MKYVIDTNVVLDVLLAREPYLAPAQQLFWAVESAVISACLCATTLTTLHYFIRKQHSPVQSAKLIEQLLGLFEIAPVTRAIVQAANESGMPDFEDAVLAKSAQMVGANAIITRNTKDFAKSGLQVFTPNEWLAAQVTLNSSN